MVVLVGLGGVVSAGRCGGVFSGSCPSSTPLLSMPDRDPMPSEAHRRNQNFFLAGRPHFVHQMQSR